MVICIPFSKNIILDYVAEFYTINSAGRRSVKPLQAKVTHSHVVAHQIFALRLIEWLDTVLGHSEGFRTLFAKILGKEIFRFKLKSMTRRIICFIKSLFLCFE